MKYKIRGAGDLIAEATKLVGIKPCGGCQERQEWLNKVLPFIGKTGYFPYGNPFINKQEKSESNKPQ
jgi:hypothetical protein